MDDRYSPVIAEFAKHGIRASLRQPDQLLLPVRIWVSWKKQWYVSTWLPALYSVPDEIDIVTLCRECLAADDGGGWYTIPKRIAEKYRLERLDEEEFQRLFPAIEDDDED